MGVEGLVIVLSILLAFGIDAWWNSVQDQALEREYLERLLEDQRANQEVIATQSRFQSGEITHARLVYPLVARGDWTGLDTLSVVVSSYLATPSPTPTWVDDTFVELISTGNVGLIRTAGLRSALLEYYRYLEFADFTYELMSTEYRDAIRERIDPDVQLAIRRTCRGREVGCALQWETWDVSAYLDWLSGNAELAGDLGKVIVQWTRGEEEYLPGVRARTDALIAQIQVELDGS